MEGMVESGSPKASYPVFKDSLALKPHPNPAEPNFASLYEDKKSWSRNKSGRLGEQLYKEERFPDGRHPLIVRPPGIDCDYETDTGPKSSLARGLSQRGFSVRTASVPDEKRFIQPPKMTGEAVGPGSYFNDQRSLVSPIRAKFMTAEGKTMKKELKIGPHWSLRPVVTPASGTRPATTASRTRSTPTMMHSTGGFRPSSRGSSRPMTGDGGERGANPYQVLAQGGSMSRGALQDYIMRHRKRMHHLETRRTVKFRRDTESDPLISTHQKDMAIWSKRSAGGAAGSIDRRGVKFGGSRRFSTQNLFLSRKAALPSPGDYFAEMPQAKGAIHKPDPRNEFPTAKRKALAGVPGKLYI